MPNPEQSLSGCDFVCNSSSDAHLTCCGKLRARIAGSHLVLKSTLLLCIFALLLPGPAGAQMPSFASCDHLWGKVGVQYIICLQRITQAEVEKAEKKEREESKARLLRLVEASNASQRRDLQQNLPACLNAARRKVLDPSSADDLNTACKQARQNYYFMQDYAGEASLNAVLCFQFSDEYACGLAGSQYLHDGIWLDRERRFSYGNRDKLGPPQDAPQGLKLLERACLLSRILRGWFSWANCRDLWNVYGGGVPVFNSERYKDELGGIYYWYFPTEVMAVQPDPALALAYLSLVCGQNVNQGTRISCNEAERRFTDVTPPQLAAAKEALSRRGLTGKTQVFSLNSLGSDVKISGTFLEWNVVHGTEAKNLDIIAEVNTAFPFVVLSMVQPQDCVALFAEPGSEIKQIRGIPGWPNQVAVRSGMFTMCLPLSGRTLQANIYPRPSASVLPMPAAHAIELSLLLAPIAAAARQKYPVPAENQTP